MGFLKAITFITLWVLLSFFWVSFGQGQVRPCESYGMADAWLKPYPTLNNWYHFYADRKGCEINEGEFFRTLASSEQLSIYLNQVGVTFEEFYVPIYNLITINWEDVDSNDFQKILSDLSSVEGSLEKTTDSMNEAVKKDFKAVVLLDLPKEFVNGAPMQLDNHKNISRRINKDLEEPPPRISSKEIAVPPVERVYTLEQPEK